MEKALSKTTQSQIEKRKAPRVTLRSEVQCRMHLTTLRGQCMNVSASGVLLSAEQVFAVGSIVSLRFELAPRSTDSVIQTEGVVVRAREGEFMAVEFLRLEPKQHLALSQYIASIS